jgi:hypothetical protein
VRLASADYPDLVLWRNSRGVAKYKKADGRETSVVYGLAPGGSDLVGIFRGRFIAIELKRDANEKPTRDQELFLQLVRRKGGFATVIWSEAGFHQAMERVLRGEDE